MRAQKWQLPSGKHTRALEIPSSLLSVQTVSLFNSRTISDAKPPHAAVLLQILGLHCMERSDACSGES